MNSGKGTRRKRRKKREDEGFSLGLRGFGGGGRCKVTKASIGVSRIKGVCVPIFQKSLESLNGNCESQALGALRNDFHVVHSNNFSTVIEQRAPGVSRTNFRGCLDVNAIGNDSVSQTHDTLRNAPFKTQRTANCENSLSLIQLLVRY